ncbi:unnamed protein product [Moneuplotes crassus]|uniref:Uncharacterized protein n=1 Tax=Euplotes crassus TaxID=5936 RepID=A0AAD1U5L6_EUPCR|nr:unnamed protein product [Moneuplotes crassus]
MLISDSSKSSSMEGYSPTQYQNILNPRFKKQRLSSKRDDITVNLTHLPLIRPISDQSQWMPQYMKEAKRAYEHTKNNSVDNLCPKDELTKEVNDDLLGYYRTKVAEKKERQRKASGVIADFNWYSGDTLSKRKSEELIKIENCQEDYFRNNEQRSRGGSLQDQQDLFFSKRQQKVTRMDRISHLRRAEAQLNRGSSIDAVDRRGSQIIIKQRKDIIMNLSKSEERRRSNILTNPTIIINKKGLKNSASFKHARLSKNGSLGQKGSKISFCRNPIRKTALIKMKSRKNMKSLS